MNKVFIKCLQTLKDNTTSDIITQGIPPMPIEKDPVYTWLLWKVNGEMEYYHRTFNFTGIAVFLNQVFFCECKHKVNENSAKGSEKSNNFYQASIRIIRYSRSISKTFAEPVKVKFKLYQCLKLELCNSK